MNVILDIAIVAIIAASIIVAAKKGFFKTLLSGSAFLIALILTVALVAPVRDILMNTAVYDGTKESISEWIYDGVMQSIPDVTDVSEEQLREYTVENNDLVALIASLGIDADELGKTVIDNSKQNISTAVKKFADDIASGVASALVGMIAALLLFLILFIAVKLLVGFISSVIKKIPVLRTADKLLGSVLGLVFGVLWVFAFVSLMHLTIPVMQTSQNAFIAAVAPADTVIFGFFYNINLFAFLI